MNEPVTHNWYSILPEKLKAPERTYRNYNKIKIDIPFRGIIVGSSGTGKTNTLVDLIFNMNCFTRIWIICKTENQPLYKMLDAVYKKAQEKEKILTISNTIEDLPNPSEIDPRFNSLVVFDDFVGEKKGELEKIAKYWTKSRHVGASCLFLSQGYFSVPRIVRLNSNLFIFKGLQPADLKLVMREFRGDYSEDELIEMYYQCNPTDLKHFFMIDLNKADMTLKYRHNFG